MKTKLNVKKHTEQKHNKKWGRNLRVQIQYPGVVQQNNVNGLTKLAVQSEEDGARPAREREDRQKGLSEKRGIRQNDASIGRG